MRHLFEGGAYLKIGCDKEKKMLKTDYLHKSLEKGRENLGLLCRQSLWQSSIGLCIARILDRELNGRVVKYNHFIIITIIIILILLLI